MKKAFVVVYEAPADFRIATDPRIRSHELTAGADDQAKRSPKRILCVLTNGEPEREQDCWQKTPLTVLRERGKDNGIVDYFAEIRKYLVPSITSEEKTETP